MMDGLLDYLPIVPMTLSSYRMARQADRTRLFIAVTGYEFRASYLLRRWKEASMLRRRDAIVVLGFKEHLDSPGRRYNDRFYSSIDVRARPLSSRDSSQFLAMLEAEIQVRAKLASPLELHFDYSSMPRSWYCAAVQLLLDRWAGRIDTFCWYTPGAYAESQFPSAGVASFKVFSGEPSLASDFRTHIFGLGFDSARALAVWSVLDPQNLITFYADPGARPEDAERAQKDNASILRIANRVMTVPLNDFPVALSKIRAATVEARRLGDVVLVPDGPKPLVLACSLIPGSLDVEGVTCFHIIRPWREQKVPDVKAIAEPIGFAFGPSVDQNHSRNSELNGSYS